MQSPIITIKSLSKIFPKKEGERRVSVLHDINLEIHQGEFLILLGPSGCGKSTLLRIVAGLEKQTAGHVIYKEGFDPKRINFVFQNFGILPWLTVFQNVELGLIGRCVPSHERVRDIDTILGQLGLTAFKDRFPHELSGGMRQRVGLARAFVTKPEVIFLDEPFSELDFFTARTLRELLLEMWKVHGTTVIMVSHYIDEAVILSDRIAVFSNRPSTIVNVIENTLPRPREYRSKPFFDLEDSVLSQFDK